jgi:hypothetical protein
MIDFKGDRLAIQLLAQEAAAIGKTFRLFSLYDGIESGYYNPLSSGKAQSKVERIMEALGLVYEGPASFYSKVEQAVFLPILQSFDSQGIKCTLSDIQEILENPDLLTTITGKTINPGQIGGLVSALLPLAAIPQINSTSPDIDLAKAMASGDVVYFDLRSGEAPAISTAIGRMIAMDLQAIAAGRTE